MLPFKCVNLVLECEKNTWWMLLDLHRAKWPSLLIELNSENNLGSDFL